jgi:cell division protease FtsH
MAYSMVSVYGMNDKIGNVSFYDSKSNEYRMTKPYSETTAETIDEEVRKLVAEAYERTKALLKSKEPELEILAKELLEKEILFQSDLENLIGKRPFAKETTYEAFTKKVVKKEEDIHTIEAAENGNGEIDEKEPQKVEDTKE